MVFSRAAQQLEAAAEHYEQSALRLDAVAERTQDCVHAVFSGREQITWQSPAGQAFITLTFHHVEAARARQSRVLEMAGTARMIASDLHTQAQQARLLAAAVTAVSAVGAELHSQALLNGALGACESAEAFLRFVQTHGGLPLARLTAG